MIRRICRLGSEVFKTLWRVVAALFNSRKVEVGRETPAPQCQQQSQSNWDDDWEDFSVTVVPNTGQDISQTTNGDVVSKESDDGIDKVLNEMQPVLKKTKKVYCTHVTSDICLGRQLV